MEAKQKKDFDSAKKVLKDAVRKHQNAERLNVDTPSELGCCELNFPNGGSIKQGGVTERDCKNAASAGGVPPIWNSGDCN